MNNDQNQFFNFVNGVYYDIGTPENYSVSRLYAWFLDAGNIGKLNNLIGTQISGICYKDNDNVCTGYALLPEPSNEQLGVYKLLFEYEYFKSESRNVAKSAMTIDDDWVTLKEGDSTVTRINKNELSKHFRSLSRDAKEDLDKAVKMYLKYNAIPDQVIGDDTQGVGNYIIQDYDRVLN